MYVVYPAKCPNNVKKKLNVHSKVYYSIKNIFSELVFSATKSVNIIRGIHTCGKKRDTNLSFCIAIKILRFFYKCGHKNLTNYCDQHRAANRKKSCDYLGISTIICITADVWTLEQIILVFYIPSFQASVSKQGQGLYSGLISGMRSSVNSIIPLGD